MGQIEDIQVFIRVVEAGGISRAAEQLNLAKSAVSRRLSELEARLRTKLIQRTTRKFNLTDEGRFYYQRAISLVDSLHELDNSILKNTGDLEGHLSISLPLSFGLLHMTSVIDNFLKQHPKLAMKVELSDGNINLVEEGIDVAFRIGQLHDSSIQARMIVPVNMLICASPDYLEEHSTPKTLEDLSEHKFLEYSLFHSSNFQIINPKGINETFVSKSRFQSNNGDFLKSMAVAGHGMIVLPSFVCWKELKSGELVRVLDDYTIPEMHGYAIYQQNRYLSPAARSFIDYLVAYFAGKPKWDEL